jgi:DNA-binding NarL/FixJ family response regulator
MGWDSVSPYWRDVAETHLTPRQLDVLRLRVDGHSWDQIAAVLDLSTSTVRGHHRASLRRLRIVFVDRKEGARR